MDLTGTTTSPTRIRTALPLEALLDALRDARVALNQKADDSRDNITRRMAPAGAEFWARRAEAADRTAATLMALTLDADGQR